MLKFRIVYIYSARESIGSSLKCGGGGARATTGLGPSKPPAVDAFCVGSIVRKNSKRQAGATPLEPSPRISTLKVPGKKHMSKTVSERMSAPLSILY